MSPKLRDPFTAIYEWRQRLIPDRIWFAMGALAVAAGSVIQGWTFHFVVPAALVVVAVVLVVLQFHRRPPADSDRNATGH